MASTVQLGGYMYAVSRRYPICMQRRDTCHKGNDKHMLHERDKCVLCEDVY